MPKSSQSGTGKQPSKRRGSGGKKPLTQQQLSDLRAFRSDLAKLKRKGLYKGDARKAKPNKRLKETIKEFKHVIEGKASVSRVRKKGDAERLRQQGYTVKNGRVVTSKEYRVRNGKVYVRGLRNARVYQLDTSDPRRSIRAAFETMKPKYGLAFRVNHHDGYEIYHTPEAMILKLELGYNYTGILERYQTYGTPILEVFDPQMSFEAFAQLSEDRKERMQGRYGKKKLWVDAKDLQGWF